MSIPEAFTPEIIAQRTATFWEKQTGVIEASVDPDDPTLVIMVTLGGKPYLIYVETAQEIPT